MNGFHIVGEVGLVSKKPVDRSFDFATVGGFTVIVNNRPVVFDWVSHSGNTASATGCRLQIDWTLNEFDVQYFRDSNEDLPIIDWEQLVKGEIDEVYYENGYIFNSKEEQVEMELAYFRIYIYDTETKEEKFFSFTEEQVKAYNNKIALERAA